MPSGAPGSLSRQLFSWPATAGPRDPALQSSGPPAAERRDRPSVTDSTLHLRPTAPLAERALLPGDPGRALALAQALLTEPKMFNHHRGLWGYTGGAPDGAPLTIQSTGMGGPSAAIVIEELADLGVRAAVRVGTCGALDPALRLGDLVLAREAIVADGTSRALGFSGRVPGDPALADALAAAHAHPSRPAHRLHAGAVVSTDLFYEPDAERNPAWAGDGALAVEMECAALFAVAVAPRHRRRLPARRQRPPARGRRARADRRRRPARGGRGDGRGRHRRAVEPAGSSAGG